MMKWKTKTESNNIGVLDLRNLMLNGDCIEVAIDIYEMSGELKEEVDKDIEHAKVCCTEMWKGYFSEYESCKPFNTNWSDKPVVIDYQFLQIIIEANESISFTIETDFHDVENEHLQSTCSTKVDLLEHIQELKKAIIDELNDKFF